MTWEKLKFSDITSRNESFFRIFDRDRSYTYNVNKMKNSVIDIVVIDKIELPGKRGE